MKVEGRILAAFRLGEPLSLSEIAKKFPYIANRTLRENLRILQGLAGGTRLIYICDYQRHVHAKPIPIYMLGDQPDLSLAEFRRKSLYDRILSIVARSDGALITQIIEAIPDVSAQLVRDAIVVLRGKNDGGKKLRVKGFLVGIGGAPRPILEIGSTKDAVVGGAEDREPAEKLSVEAIQRLKTLRDRHEMRRLEKMLNDLS